jgi:hypothetical protein
MNARRLVLAVLCTVTGAFAVSTAPALAATSNAYQSQFNGSLTAATSFSPHGLAVNKSGDVYVVDSAHKVVDELGPSGTGAPLAEFKASAGESFYAESVAVNASGDVYVIVNESGGEHNVVDEFNPNGTVLGKFNGGKTAGRTPGESFYAESVAVNASGDVYVADADGRVEEFSPSPSGEPEPLAEFNGKKTVGESFYPIALAVNASAIGDVYVVDAGHNVVDEFGPAATGEPEPEPLAELSGGQTPQGSWEPSRVAVAANGEVYVVDTEHRVVDRFDSSGSYLSQFEGGATPQGSLGEPASAFGVAVDPSGQVYVDGASGFVDLFSEPVTVPIVITGPPSNVLLTSATLTGSIEPVTGIDVSCEFRYGLGTEYGQKALCTPAGPFSSLNAVTADLVGLQPATTYHYRLEGTTSNGTTPGADETVTTAARLVPPPTVSIEPVEPIAIGEHSATFSGEVNPNESETTYHFEYSSDGVNWTPLKVENAGNGSSEVSVTQTVTGLTGHTRYRVRLVAVNSCGPGTAGCGASTSSEATFSTLAAPQQVSGTGATAINSGAATLRATIRTENNPTTYRFEYGPTAAYGTTVPAGEGDLGASSTPTQVSQAIAGLSPDTTYHFRVVASNGVGVPTATPDQTFTTFSSAGAPGGCPNEQVRKESAVNPETGKPFSMQLPECRAYEMVSPVLKNGAPISSAGQVAFETGSTVARVGPEGSTVLIRSSSIWPGEQPANNNLLATAADEAVQYKITRGESGWSHRPEVPPNLLHFRNELLPYPADMSTNGIWVGGGLAPTEAQIDLLNSPNIYFLEPDGALAKVGPSVPPSDQDQVVEGGADHSPGDSARGAVYIVGGSANLSRVLFNVSTYRWPFDETRLGSFAGTQVSSLYEYIGTGHSGEGGDLPTLVGVDNAGALISQCGTEAAGYEDNSGGALRLPGSVEAEARSISAGGSTVFFVGRGVGSPECNGGAAPAENQVFARVGEPGAGTAVGKAVTVNVAGTTGCATSDSCNVTKAVTYQGASTDGSKVFFTSEQPLLAGDTDSTSNLYECGGLPGDSGAPLAASSKGVNPCPDLVRVSVPVSGTGAEVQSVVSISADGSHVYFVAKGVLSGENAEHNSPTSGQDNLYVWQQPSPGYPQGGTAFIATLSAALGFGEAQMTPDGEQLVFTSSADLTPDDTSTVSQVFLYEARREALIRVSKGQDGFNNDGNTTSDPAYISTAAKTGGSPNVLEGRRTISEDGSVVVFQSDDALTPQVHGGTRNVYLWRGGNVYLISDGIPAGNEPGGGTIKAAEQAGLVGIDASGQNVFFTTEAKLVGQDGDELSDLYDARIGGGFPAPKVNECVGEACQGAPSAPPGPLSPGSLSPSGQGNLAPLAPVKSTTPPPKPLTRAQKLAKALKACTKDKAKKKRAECQATARKLYGAKQKAKKRKTGKSVGKGGKR